LMARGAIDVGLRWIAPIATLEAPIARSFKVGS